jgi:hypothetical protein
LCTFGESDEGDADSQSDEEAQQTDEDNIKLRASFLASTLNTIYMLRQTSTTVAKVASMREMMV